MKYFNVGTIILGLIFSIACPAAASNEQKPDGLISTNIWKLIEGDWIRKNFVQDVQKNRSIYTVVKATGMHFHSSSRKSLTFEFIIDGTFGQHAVIRRAKQCWIKSLSRTKNKIVLGLEDTEDKNSFCFDFPKELRLRDTEPQPQEIEIANAIYIPNKKDWLLRATIAGSYQDATGRNFSFTPDGKAQWPDQELRYSIADYDSNFKEIDSDYFSAGMDAKTERLYCFRWEKAYLVISPVIQKQGHNTCSPTPIYKLKLIK